MRGTSRRTDGRTDGRMDGQTNERYGEIRSETVGGPSRLASIHSPPNSLDLLISFSSRTLSLFSFFLSPLNLRSFPLRLVSSILLRHVFHLPRAFSILFASLSRLYLIFSPASLFVVLTLLSLFLSPSPSSPSFRRVFVASFSPHHSLPVILCVTSPLS